MKNNSEEVLQYKGVTWINLVMPTEEMLESLVKRYKFHQLDLEDIMSENQRSKIDEYPKYLFLVLNIPYLDRRKKRVEVEKLDVFLSKNYLITIHSKKLDVLQGFFEECRDSLKSRKEYMAKGSGYVLYEILDQLFDRVFPMVDQLERSAHSIERVLFDDRSKSTNQRDKLRDILLLKKDIISLKRGLSPMRQVLPQLEHKHRRFLTENLEIYFDNVVDKVEKVWANIDNLKELIESVEDINESIISHTTNNVIKILTVFSVVMMPMTVITGFYGMNINLPLGQQAGGSPHTVWLLLILMGFVAIGMLLFFRFKKWL